MTTLMTLLLLIVSNSCTGTGERPIQENFIVDAQNRTVEKATFAGGCFWCMEASFEKLEGVIQVISGYTGGPEVNPGYNAVSSGTTGHLEAIQVSYDPELISYEALLDAFWRQIDPTDDGGSFADRGPQYRSAIFYHGSVQEGMAKTSKEKIALSGRYEHSIVTEIREAVAFYPAEDYHQDFYKTNPIRYKFYRRGSGRDQYLKKVWSGQENLKGSTVSQARAGEDRSHYQRPSAEILKEKLTPLQYQVTQKEGTEPPFKNLYWNNKEDGIYVDIVSGEPLFSSLDKFDSKTGWPSFTKTLEAGLVIEKKDSSLFMSRTELRSKIADSHLGHLFNDGPAPTGLRYCINSAAMRFIPSEKLQAEGYEKYAKLFSP